MHEVDRSIHPSVSQSKAIDERIQPGGGERINGKGGNELTEPKMQRQVVLNVIGKVSLREQRGSPSGKRRERGTGETTVSIFFGKMIFDYVESRFTENRFCSKEAATTFTNGPYFPHAAFLPSPLQQTRLDNKTRHFSNLYSDIFSICKERFSGKSLTDNFA